MRFDHIGIRKFGNPEVANLRSYIWKNFEARSGWILMGEDLRRWVGFQISYRGRFSKIFKNPDPYRGRFSSLILLINVWARIAKIFPHKDLGFCRNLRNLRLLCWQILLKSCSKKCCILNRKLFSDQVSLWGKIFEDFFRKIKEMLYT